MTSVEALPNDAVRCVSCTSCAPMRVYGPRSALAPLFRPHFHDLDLAKDGNNVDTAGERDCHACRDSKQWRERIPMSRLRFPERRHHAAPAAEPSITAAGHAAGGAGVHRFRIRDVSMHVFSGRSSHGSSGSSHHSSHSSSGSGSSRGAGSSGRSFLLDLAEGHLDVFYHLVITGGLSIADVAALEGTCKRMRGIKVDTSVGIMSLTECVCFHLCSQLPLLHDLSSASQQQLVKRCNGSWKLLLSVMKKSPGFQERSQVFANHASCRSTGNTTAVVTSHGRVFAHGCLLPFGKASPIDAKSTEGLVPLACAANIRVVQVALGASHTALLSASGIVFTFGDDRWGQCGIGARPNREVESPTEMQGLEGEFVTSVAAGGTFTMALTAKGTVFACGHTDFTGLGPQLLSCMTSPRQVSFPDSPVEIKQISCGSTFSAAVCSKGRVYEWGGLPRGGTTPEAQTEHPQLTPQLNAYFHCKQIKISSVSCGSIHLAGFDNKRKVYTWHHLIRPRKGRRDDAAKSVMVREVKLPSVVSPAEVAAGVYGRTAVLSSGGMIFLTDESSEEVQTAREASHVFRETENSNWKHYPNQLAIGANQLALVDPSQGLQCFHWEDHELQPMFIPDERHLSEVAADFA